MISVALQHHPSRADLLWRTAAARPEIVPDPDPDAFPSAWRTYLAALAASPENASHRVVLQDDVELAGGFLAALRLALAARPDHLVTLFVPTTLRQGARRVLEACARDDAWAALDPYETWVPAVALAWPARLISDFVAWGRSRYPPETRRFADDALIGLFVRERGERVWATVPSLVEHPDDVPTILQDGRNVHERHAACFAGERAAAIDWSRG